MFLSLRRAPARPLSPSIHMAPRSSAASAALLTRLTRAATQRATHATSCAWRSQPWRACRAQRAAVAVPQLAASAASASWTPHEARREDGGAVGGVSVRECLCCRRRCRPVHTSEFRLQRLLLPLDLAHPFLCELRRRDSLGSLVGVVRRKPLSCSECDRCRLLRCGRPAPCLVRCSRPAPCLVRRPLRIRKLTPRSCRVCPPDCCLCRGSSLVRGRRRLLKGRRLTTKTCGRR